MRDWDAPDSPFYTVRFFVLEEQEDEWSLAHHGGRYRAITAAALARIAQDAGFREISWQTGEQAGYHQPLMTARG